MKQAHQIPAPGRQALVIGAGLAGCALADAFSRRGWQVTVLEAGHHAGGAVASLPLIAQHPAISPDFDRRSRLLIEALCQHAALRAGPAADIQPAFEVCGRLQPMDLALAQRCAAHVPDTVARAVTGLHETPAAIGAENTGTADDASKAGSARRTATGSLRPATEAAYPHSAPGTDTASQTPGLWFPGVAALSPARWWEQVLQRNNVRLCLNTPVGRIEAGQGQTDAVHQTAEIRAETKAPGSKITPGTDAPGTFAGQKPANEDSSAAVAPLPAPHWQAFSADGSLIAEADVLVLACQADAFRLAGMQEDDHGRLRFAPARVWVSTAEAACHSPDQGSCPADASRQQLQSNTPADQTDSPIDPTATSCDHGMFEALPPAEQTRPEPPGAMPAAEAFDLAHADPGSPPLSPIQSEHGLCLERPGRFRMHNDEYHKHWLAARLDHHQGEARKAGKAAPAEGPATGSPDNPAMTADSRHWHPSEQGERLQLRDNLPMIGLAPDLDRISEIADDLARNDRLPIPRRAGLYLLTGLAGRGSLYAAIGAEMIAANASAEPSPVPTDLQAASDPARFIKRRLQRAWSQR